MKLRPAHLPLALLASALTLAAPFEGLAQSPAPAPADPNAPAEAGPRRPFRERWLQRQQQQQQGQPGQQRPWMQRQFGQGGLGQRQGFLPPAMIARQQFMQSLTPEERQKLRAARQAAMQDPQIRAALEKRAADQKAFRDSMKGAVIRADPSVAPLVERFEQKLQEQRAQRLQGFQRKLEFLSAEERQILMQARRAVQADPALASARQQGEAATDPAARQQAMRIYNQAMKNAMIRQDPRVGPILEKVRQQRPNAPQAGQ